MFKKLIKMFSKPTNMQQARDMMRVARQNKASGYNCATKAAVQAAMSFRAAHHAARYYA